MPADEIDISIFLFLEIVLKFSIFSAHSISSAKLQYLEAANSLSGFRLDAPLYCKILSQKAWLSVLFPVN